MDDILKVTGLNKSYDNFSLKDVSFTLRKDVSRDLLALTAQAKQLLYDLY